VKLLAAPQSVDRAEKRQFIPLGLEVRELTQDVLYDYNLPLNTQGVYVYQVDRAAPAGLGGMTIGSIITEIDDKQVKNLKSFEKILNDILEKEPEKIMFRVQVSKETMFIFVDTK
jgi:S1-C subfamily serine protease